MADPWQVEHFLKQTQDPIKALWDEDKESFGSSQSPLRIHTLTQFDKENSPLASYGSLDNQNLAKQQAIDTCNAVLPSPRRNLCKAFEECLETVSTVNYRGQKQLSPIATKSLQEMAMRLNMAHGRSEEMKNEIGSPSGPPRSPEILMPYRQMYEWYLTGPSGRLPATSQLACQLNDMLLSFGVVHALENQDVLGMKQESMLMLKIQDPSSGTVIKLRETLLLMNFEEESMYRIYLDGSTVIRCVWKSKDQRDRRLWKRSGSHPMSTQSFGTRI